MEFKRRNRLSQDGYSKCLKGSATSELIKHFLIYRHTASVLINTMNNGETGKRLTRNAFDYLLDRMTRAVLLGHALAHQTWAKRLDSEGHPVVNPGQAFHSKEFTSALIHLALSIGADFSFDPKTCLFFVAARHACDVCTSKPKGPSLTYLGIGSAHAA